MKEENKEERRNSVSVGLVGCIIIFEMVFIFKHTDADDESFHQERQSFSLSFWNPLDDQLLTDSLTNRPTDRPTDRLTDCLSDRQTEQTPNNYRQK